MKYPEEPPRKPATAFDNGSSDDTRSRADSASRSGERDTAPTGKHDDAGRTASEAGDALQILLRLGAELFGAVDTLIEVYADRLRESMRRKVVQTVSLASVSVCLTVWMAAAALAVLRGARGGLTAWSGRAWAGDLAAGLLALLLTVGAVVLCLRLSARRELRTLKAKYERIPDEPEKSRATAVPAENGQGAARVAGSAGDPADHGGAGAREHGPVGHG